jgi:iron complex outermembrane receptor protein
LKNSKLDVDLGYVANDRSEFVDSDVAGLHMKLKTLITMRSTICLKWVTGINCWNSRNASNTNLGKYLIPDATTNDFGVFWTINYEWDNSVLQAGLRFDNRKIVSIENGTMGEEGYFVDKSFDSFNASLGYKMDLG